MSEEEQDKQSEGLLPIDEHEEIVSEDGRKVRRRGIYLLPNVMTLGALFSGFYAIIAVMSGNFNEAGWAIFIAGILDGLDGRIARLTNTQSAFGAQFDSLSDMVSFGVAPALIMFSWAFEPLGRLGWAASFIYMACAALRLARFNVQLGTVDRRFLRRSTESNGSGGSCFPALGWLQVWLRSYSLGCPLMRDIDCIYRLPHDIELQLFQL